MNRREALKLLGAGVMAGAGGRLAGQEPAFLPDVELTMSAAPGTVQIRPGAPTRVWRYTAELIKGPADTLQTMAGSYLGPTIRLRRGQKVRVRFTNRLDEPTIVHWHGLDVPEKADGHPRFAIAPGQSYVYEFEVINRAGTYWYHPHPHHRTGAQVSNGLTGLLIVTDPEEAALELPSGAEDIACVIQDRSFTAENQLTYVSAMPMDRMMGFLGDQVLVNGRPQAALALATRAYRLRLMNGSSSRIYKLAWEDGTPFTVIGSDGGLLERAVTRRYLTLAPAERAEILLDLGARPVGTTLTLRSLGFTGTASEMGMARGRGRGMGMGMGMMRGRAAVAQGVPIQVLTVKIDRREPSRFALPDRLSAYGAPWQPEASSQPTRTFTMRMAPMQWLLNDRVFELTAVAANESIRRGAKEIWEFANPGTGMMQMAHPIHLHAGQFRVLRRIVDPAAGASWRGLSEGFVDEGWKDTTLVMPGERVQLLVQFRHYSGLFLYHCHILEHEDLGMMRNFRVT